MKIDRQIDRQVGRQIRQIEQNRHTKQQVPLDRDRYARAHATIDPDRKINIDG